MTILFRSLWATVAAFLRDRMTIDQTSLLRRRVWPNDLDINIHMNNSRYLAVMDLGRFDWVIRTGVWRLMSRESMAPIIGGAMVRFRRSLVPFERFELRTRLLGWDERWIYLEHTITGKKGLACIAVVRSGFTKSGKLVPPAELAVKLDYRGPNLPAPDWVADWNATEETFVRKSVSSQWSS